MINTTVLTEDILNKTNNTITSAGFIYSLEYKIGLSIITMMAVPFHISHVTLIFLKNNLHQNIYVLIANLSVSDSLLCVVVTAGTVMDGWTKYTLGIMGIFYTASVLLTLGIALDRYV